MLRMPRMFRSCLARLPRMPRMFCSCFARLPGMPGMPRWLAYCPHSQAHDVPSKYAEKLFEKR